MFKAMKTLYKCIRNFVTGFAIGWKGADTREWKSMNTRNEYSRNASMTDPDIYRRLGYYRCARCSELWPSGMECPCLPKIENRMRKIGNHTPNRHHDSGLMFLFGILLGVAILGDDEDEDA